MGRAAWVKSIDALQSMSAAVECFHSDASSALDDLDMEIRRALQWIGEDCRQYWKEEVRRRWDRVTEAKQQLEHAQTFRRIEGQKSSCIEEKKALAAAKRHLDLAQDKLKAISHWVVAIERAVNEYRGIRSHLLNWLDADFPRAVAALSRMIANLENYVRSPMPVDDLPPIADAPAPTAADANNAHTLKTGPENTGQVKNPESRTPNHI
jgi:hypothetical protein